MPALEPLASAVITQNAETRSYLSTWNAKAAGKRFADSRWYAASVRPAPDIDRREIADYLWQFTFYGPSRSAVIGTYSEDRPGSLDHTLVLVGVIRQGFEQCEPIEVVDWTFSADRHSGKVTKRCQLVRQFDAELVSGMPRRCTN